MVNKDEF